jgi:hypothetical protein
MPSKKEGASNCGGSVRFPYGREGKIRREKK